MLEHKPTSPERLHKAESDIMKSGDRENKTWPLTEKFKWKEDHLLEEHAVQN